MKTKTLVQRLFSQPTAPFREGWVLHEISQILKEHNIPYFRDDVGNLIAGARSARALGTRPRLALQAHTDHPGFHIVEALGKGRYRALWYGGAPFDTMKGAKLRVYDPSKRGFSVQARCVSLETQPYSREGMPLVIEVPSPIDLNLNCFGAFDFKAFELQGQHIHARVADDLAGVAIALGALLDSGLKEKGLAVFTRAEEVGFVGCWPLLKSGLLPAQTWLLCLEASRELPMAELGQGPVLRLGDRSTIYTSEFGVWMWKVAEELKKKSRSFRYQRRLMDGGSCEATAMSLHGYCTSGLAVPLRNYHNQGKSKPQPEVISLQDVDNARTLCAELYREFASRPRSQKAMKAGLEKNFKQLRKLLLSKVEFAL